MATPPFDDPPTDDPGPAETKIIQTMAFYLVALEHGPRNPREELKEGLALGHAKRTQERARTRLHVQKIPPATWQGPWLIALPDGPAVKAARQRKEAKDQKKQKRKGNGRKQRKRDGSSRKPRDEVIAALC